MAYIFTLFALSLVTLKCFTNGARLVPLDKIDQDDKPWDYLMFVQRWPPSVCGGMAENECEIPSQINDWVVHGLWPNYNDGTWPQYCDNDDKFDVDKVQSLRPTLEQRWPNLEEGQPSESLWAHEWEKHGTCAKTLATLGDEQKYFTSSLNLLNINHIGDALKKSNIVPSDTVTYTKAQIEAALRDNIGNGSDLFDLACVRGSVPQEPTNSPYEDFRHHRHRRPQDDGKVALFVEARACIDKQLALMSCPDAAQQSRILEPSSPFYERARRALFNVFSWAPPPQVAPTTTMMRVRDDGDDCPDTGIYIPTFQS